jgi:SAM-dependent methyltransferase
MMTNLNLTDMETCYKVFRAEVIKGVPLRSQRFGIEPEITAKVARLRARIYEVPISYAGRSYLEGKKIGWRDGVAAIWTILKYAVIDDTTSADDAGFLTLRRMETLHGYNAWVGELIEPHLGEHVLEVGAGIGNMTRLIGRRHRVVATDVDPRYLEHLRRLFASDSRVDVAGFDLEADGIPVEGAPFDSVVCLNVLEHIADDAAALRRLREQLKPGGRVVLVVPALKALYGEMDRAIHHHRRYEREELVERVRAAGFEIDHLSTYNALGIPGWFLNGRILGRRSVPGVQARLNSLLVPLLRLERHLGLPWGLSLLVVGRRV